MESNYGDYLEIVGNWAAIFTAAVAVFGYGKYQWDKCSRKRTLENYLKNEKSAGKDRGQRTIIHLIAKLGMTEAQILDASFNSTKINRRVDVDNDTRKAVDILLESAEL